MRAKRVIVCETGEIFASTRQAERLLGISNANIVRNCNGEYQSTHGLHFRYLDDLPEDYPEEEYDDSFEEDALNEIFNQLNKKEETEIEKTLEKMLIPLSIKIGVEVEKSIIDVLEHCIVTEELDENGRYNLRFKFDFKEC